MVILWVSVRIIWEIAFPVSVVGAVEAAEMVNMPAPTGAASPSAPLPVLMRTKVTKSDQKGGRRVTYPEARTPLIASAFALSQPSTTAKETPAAPPRQVSQRQAAGIVPSSTKPLSGYFWLFARQSSGAGPSGAAVPVLQSPGGQYGGSQAGAILTYRLAGASQSHLSAFVRASSALKDAGQEELAIGLSARPFARIPLSLFAEKRMGAGQFHSRGTAVYVAGGTGPDLLPKILPEKLPEILIADTSLETYGQAGFLFADNDSYFFDVSANLQRKLWEQGHYKLTAGAGAWAGGQEGVTRFDIGPRANIHIPVGKNDMRLSLDWRQRIGGNAVPDSGVAVTVSTGF
ncbi:hypothetical protein [Parasphingorhabdus sp.]|uniref:hypothetical protein n=1 Tax=Parasphingorhabdus sp. TaxID=2709688 RepID=UPI002F9242CA